MVRYRLDRGRDHFFVLLAGDSVGKGLAGRVSTLKRRRLGVCSRQVDFGRVARRVTFYFADDRWIVLLTTFRKQRQNERAEVRRARGAMRRCIAEGHAPEEE